MYKYLKVLSILAVIAMLASCAPAKTAEPPPATQPAVQPTQVQPTTPPAAKESVTISFMRPGLGDDALKEVQAQMKPFNEKYPWITVEPLIVAPPDLATKLQTAIAGGAPPDIVQGISAGDAIKYETNGQLLDLAPYAAKDGFDWKTYYNQEGLNVFNQKDTLQCVMESSDSTTLAYNKDMFDAAGVAYPNDNWTWDDMLAAAQKLTKDTNGDGKTDQWGLAIITWDYQPWIWAAGGSFFNSDFSQTQITDPVVTDTLQWLADLRFKYKVSPTEDVRKAFPEVGFMFQQGQIAMYTTRWIPDVAFFFPPIKFNWDVAVLPKNPKTGNRVAGFGGGCIGVFKATKHPEEAYLVWKWMTGDDGVYARSVSNTGTPMMPGGPADKWPKLAAAFKQVKTPANAKAFIDMLPFTRLTELPVVTRNEVYATMDPILDDLWLGNKTAAEVAPLVKAAVDPLLKK